VIEGIAQRKLFPEGSAIVIGGSGGIGAMICKTFASHGVPVIFTYHGNESAAKDLTKEITQFGGIASHHKLSINDRNQVEIFFQELENSRIHSIVNATGSDIRMKWINELSYEEWDDVMRTDADGFFNIIKNSLPILKKFGGSYTTLSSIGLSRWPAKDVLSVAQKQLLIL
jgi:3-oxoacyl-[acyl-carrier protein] reductase